MTPQRAALELLAAYHQGVSRLIESTPIETCPKDSQHLQEIIRIGTELTSQVNTAQLNNVNVNGNGKRARRDSVASDVSVVTTTTTTAPERKSRHVWTKEETDKLRALYEEYGNDVPSIHMSFGDDLTAEQIRGKLKTLGLVKKAEPVNKKAKTEGEKDDDKSENSDTD